MVGFFFGWIIPQTVGFSEANGCGSNEVREPAYQVSTKIFGHSVRMDAG